MTYYPPKVHTNHDLLAGLFPGLYYIIYKTSYIDKTRATSHSGAKGLYGTKVGETLLGDVRSVSLNECIFIGQLLRV